MDYKDLLDLTPEEMDRKEQNGQKGDKGDKEEPGIWWDLQDHTGLVSEGAVYTRWEKTSYWMGSRICRICND